MANSESNNGLYFVVGALLVLVVGLGVFYVYDDNPGGSDTIERTIERTIETGNDSGDNSSFELRVDEDGVSAKTESE